MSIQNYKELQHIESVSTLKLELISEMKEILKLPENEKKILMDEKVINQIRYAGEKTNFYKQLYKEAGIDPIAITEVSGIEKIPFTTKENLRQLYPLNLMAVDADRLCRYAESTGTTGTPTSSFFTRSDWFRSNLYTAYKLLDHLSDKDTAVIAAPYELSVPAQDLERVFELIGITVIACGVLNEVCTWERLINIINTTKPTTLVCSGTRALLMAEMAVQMGFDPAQDFKIRKILNLGETANDVKAKKIKEVWNADIINAYGMTETCALGITCVHGNMHIIDDRHYYEIIDPESNKILPFGEKGELVVTPLENKAMPLIRYRTGDQVMLEEIECPCGSKTPVLIHYGRMGESIVIGDYQTTCLKLEEFIMNCKGHDKLYRVHITKNNITFTLDLKAGYPPEQLKNELISQFPENIRQKIDVKFFTPKDQKDYFAFLKGSLKPFSKMFTVE